jgi:hypothetical protein
MNKGFTILLFVILFILTDCSEKKEKTNVSYGKKQNEISAVSPLQNQKLYYTKLDNYFNHITELFGETVEEVYQNLGKPKEHKIEIVKNIHNPQQKDKVHKLLYDGATIQIYEVAQDKKQILVSITITSDKYNLGEVNIGTQKDKLEEIFGPPSNVDNNIYTYAVEESESIEFVIKNNKVYSITLNYYID